MNNNSGMKLMPLCQFPLWNRPNHQAFVLKNKFYPALKDEPFPFTLNGDLFKTAKDNSFIFSNNLLKK
ncbi:hypothetical protein MXB_1889 [Myxobolus squamalis]|nr:hypothetical protein MXB_1889 [Myxobolus squamalis]